MSMALRSTTSAAAFQQLTRSETSILTMSEDIDVTSLFDLVKDILSPATLHGTQAHGGITHVELHITHMIDRISCEIASRVLGGSDAHATTLSISDMLPSYSWDAKLVLTLAAFALNYGELWLLAQIYSTNQLANSMAILRQVFVLMDSGSLKPRFEALEKLISVIVDVTQFIIEFHQLPRMDNSEAEDKNLFPVAGYWTIRSVVACATQITSLTSMGHDYTTLTTAERELSPLIQRLQAVHDNLKEKLEERNKAIAEMFENRMFNDLQDICKYPQSDNMKLLQPIINPKDEIHPLVDGSTKTKISLDVLLKKNVLLLISDLDISHDELSILEQIYNKSKRYYEVVWIPIFPIVQGTDYPMKTLESQQDKMPWYSVRNPKNIEKAVIKFIKDEWKFTYKPILVVLDPQGSVVSLNAIHMMLIWGSRGFPFSNKAEDDLWRNETWRLEFLVNDIIDPKLFNWITQEKFVCLYGGDDIDWIREFTKTARYVSQAAGISLEIVYVGKSNLRDKARNNILSTINKDKLSYYLQDSKSFWYFWVRLQSMWHSKNRLVEIAEDDPIMKKIMKMLSFDRSDGGWAILGRGSAELLAKAKGDIFLTGLLQYDQWKEHVQPKGFVQALHDHLRQLHHPTHHCNSLALPVAAGRTPENVPCHDCGRIMERFVLYHCCDDE